MLNLPNHLFDGYSFSTRDLFEIDLTVDLLDDKDLYFRFIDSRFNNDILGGFDVIFLYIGIDQVEERFAEFLYFTKPNPVYLGHFLLGCRISGRHFLQRWILENYIGW